jgi:zinc transport system ATP-binding protein
VTARDATCRTPGGPPQIRCEGLVVGYGGNPLLPPVDLEMSCGEFWAVVGRNGSGKSTFFKTLLGLIPPVAGRVEQPRGPIRIAYLAQRATFDALYPVSVAQVVEMGTVHGWSFLRPSGGEDRAAARAALEEVGMAEHARRTFRSLSEGQKQRVLFARMIASGAPIALLDEPTVAMDAVAEQEAMELLDRLRRRHHLTVVVVTHYLRVARDMAERLLFVDPDGRNSIVGPPDEVFAHPAFVARYGAMAKEVADG